jgi:hypothetical protein
MDFLISPIYSSYWPATASGGAADTLNSFIKVNFSSSANVAGQLEALNGLYARAYQMLSAADQLSGSEGRANFSQRPANSTDMDVAQVAYFDKTYYQAQVPESRFTFEVQQIARNQVNQGTTLNPDTASAVNSGSNTFTLNVGGTAYTLTVTINAGDTNSTALGKIAQAIDAANAGVSASMVRGSGAIRLDLYGQTGAAQAFSLADTSGNAVSAAGLNSSAQTARDAEFLRNGTTYIQAGNRVSLMDGHLQVDLTGPGSAAVTTGPLRAVDLAQSLTEAMSGFGSYLKENPYLISSISSAWSGLVHREAAILSKYGLEAGAFGQVGLDTLKFTSQLQQGSAQAAEAMSGLASRVKEFVKGLTSLPAASLLASPPTAGYASSYLSSTASAPWRQAGTGGFWRIA